MEKVKLQCIDEDILKFYYKNREVRIYIDNGTKKCWFCLQDIERIGKIKSISYRIQQILKKKEISSNPICYIKLFSLQNENYLKFILINLIDELMEFSYTPKQEKDDFLFWLHQIEANILSKKDDIEKIIKENQKLENENKELIEKIDRIQKNAIEEIRRIQSERELGEREEISDLKCSLQDKEEMIKHLKGQIDKLSKERAEIYVAYRCCYYSREEFEYKLKVLQEKYEKDTGTKLEEDFYL